MNMYKREGNLYNIKQNILYAKQSDYYCLTLWSHFSCQIKNLSLLDF
jgi:hypothetical protein